MLISSTAIISCAGAPKFPTKELYEVNINPENKQWVCGKYEITDAARRKYKHVADVDFINCKGVWGFKDSDLPKIFQWMDDSEVYYKEKLKRCQ